MIRSCRRLRRWCTGSTSTLLYRTSRTCQHSLIAWTSWRRSSLVLLMRHHIGTCVLLGTLLDLQQHYYLNSLLHSKDTCEGVSPGSSARGGLPPRTLSTATIHVSFSLCSRTASYPS
eukprot:2054508-Amphidinium_carterae.2